jgi:hypothetical protein
MSTPSFSVICQFALQGTCLQMWCNFSFFVLSLWFYLLYFLRNLLLLMSALVCIEVSALYVNMGICNILITYIVLISSETLYSANSL